MLLGPDEVPDFRLSSLAEHFATRSVPCHRALADARATAEVLSSLLELAADAKRALPPGPAPHQPGLLRLLIRRYATAASRRPGSPVRPAEATRG